MALVNSVDPVKAQPALRETLARKLDGVTDVEVSDVYASTAAGLSAETVMLTASWTHHGETVKRDLVARVAPKGDGLFIAYDLPLEARVMAALSEHTSVRVPEILCHEGDPSALGSPFFIMERIGGRSVSDDPPFTMQGWLFDLPPQRQRVLHDNALTAFAEVPKVDPVALGLADMGRYDASDGDPLTGQIEHWERAFAWAADATPNPYVESGFEWVKANRPTDPEPLTLSWGDAGIRNMVFADDLSVAAVIDWEQVSLGSPELDLGWWFAALRLFSDGIGIPGLPGFPSRAETVERYEQLTGLTVRNIDFYEAFSYLRLSVAMIRGARMLIAAGALPPDAGMEFNNPATRLLAELTGAQPPTEDSQYFIGNRN